MTCHARVLGTAAVLVLALLGSVGCGPGDLAPTADRSPATTTAESSATAGSSVTATPSPPSAPEPTSPAPGPGAGQAALAVLATLEVKGRAPKTGYDRARFGPAWMDVDRNGCDTRNDMLARDLTAEVLKPGTHNCVVTSGNLADPYTATTIAFLRGDGTSVDIDHVVALSNGWQTGAFGWDGTKRAAFANDPLNLLAVDFAANRQKGDGDAATWLPANKGYRCAYVARQIAVKASYGLWVTPPEKDAMARVLGGCPTEPLPNEGGAHIAVAPAAVAPTSAAAPAPDPRPAPAPAPGPAAVYYANCDAVRAAGAAPIRSGDPGFQSTFDRDNDGVGCE